MGENMNKGIDGVKFCDYEEEVNEWIAKNDDKIVIDVKVTSTYNIREEIPMTGFLIVWTYPSI